MTNMFGDEVNPADAQLHFEWHGVNMNILRGDPFTNEAGVKGCQKYVGTVHPNGWNGYAMDITSPLAEPILINVHETLSFSEMRVIMEKFNEKLSPKVALQNVIARLAKEKGMSVDDTIKYIAEKKIPCVSI